MRSSWWLPLTWLIGSRSASIMPVSLAHGRALEMMRSDQSIQSILHDGGGDHVDSLHGATSMMTVSVSVGDSSPLELLGQKSDFSRKTTPADLGAPPHSYRRRPGPMYLSSHLSTDFGM